MPTRHYATARWKLPIILGAMLLIAAAFEPVWTRHKPPKIIVMVDLSASARGASYRDPTLLRHDISQCLGDQLYKIVFFAADNQPGSLDGSDRLSDLPSDETHFNPPSADAILLFSDGEFSPPAVSPPVYPFLDPSLDAATDAAITNMEIRGDELAVSVRNNGPPRQLTVLSTTRPVTGNQTFIFPLTTRGRITAQLSQGDLWPENDTQEITSIPPLHSQRWWIGMFPPDNYRPISPADLADFDSAEFLAPSVIVLDDISATDLPPIAADRLETYVRDLSGTLVILGGPHAFAVGDYDGSILGTLSPLASSPPSPTTQWLLLADSSGSMANNNLWTHAATAIVGVVPHLPPHDPVFVGQFAESLRWWSAGQSAADTARLNLPPPDALPHGPTNLETVLDSIIRDSAGAIPAQLLLVTDADVTFDHPDAIAAGLLQKKIHLHLLAIANGRGLETLQKIAAITGGSVLAQLDPAEWPATAQKLLQSAIPSRWSTTPQQVRFIGPASSLGNVTASQWNRTWLTPGATPLTEGDIPMAALQNFGTGKVIAATFPTPALADLFAQPPSDPRFKIKWETGPDLTLSIDAANAGSYLNDLPLQLTLANNSPIPIAQVAPGEYQISVPALRHPTIGSVLLNGKVLDMDTIPGRYPREFDTIGLDKKALEALADQTGGKVIPPNQTTPISISGPDEKLELMPWLATAGATFIAIGLVMWKQA